MGHISPGLQLVLEFTPGRRLRATIKFHFYIILDFNGSLIFYCGAKVNFRVIGYCDQRQRRTLFFVKLSKFTSDPLHEIIYAANMGMEERVNEILPLLVTMALFFLQWQFTFAIQYSGMRKKGLHNFLLLCTRS